MAVLRLQKRAKKKLTITPSDLLGEVEPRATGCFGERLDNACLKYDPQKTPRTAQEFDFFRFVNKTYVGYYLWPKTLEIYAPLAHQPSLRRNRDELDPSEVPIYDHFIEPQFLDDLVRFFSIEENKGREKFDTNRYLLFKGLFRNFGDTFFDAFVPHLRRLVIDRNKETAEASHKCAAEMVTGIIRGAKHWPFEMLEGMWDKLLPILSDALQNLSPENRDDWGTCFATMMEDGDPRRLHRIIEFLSLLAQTEETRTFHEANYLYLLQGGFSQQEWRIPATLNQFYRVLASKFDHPYKSVRDRVGSIVASSMLFDIEIPFNHSSNTESPTIRMFLSEVVPRLEQLVTITRSIHEPKSGSTEGALVAAAMPTDAVAGVADAELEEEQLVVPTANEEETKKLVSLCKTVNQAITTKISRSFQSLTGDMLQLIPILCHLCTDAFKDDELKQGSMVALTLLSQCQMHEVHLPIYLAAAQQAAASPNWHSRVAILDSLSVTLFSNLFMLLHSPAFVQDARSLVLGLLSDSRIEVRIRAASTVQSMFHSGFLDVSDELLGYFRQKAHTKIPRGQTLSAVSRPLIERHSGVLGMGAVVLSHPYQVPHYVPDVIVQLSNHLHDPHPIHESVRDILSDFKRTHLDSWREHKAKFTEEQLLTLTDLLVSPNYYA